MDIYASCINKKKIKSNKVRKFTLAIESSIKANLKKIMLTWRYWVSKIVKVKSDAETNLKFRCY